MIPETETGLRIEAQAQSETSRAVRRLRLDIAFTLLLLVGLFAFVLLDPRGTGHPKATGVVVGSLLSAFGPTLLISLLEQFLPVGGPRKSFKQWLLHVQIMIANYASGLLGFGVLAFYIASAVVHFFHLDLGLIDLRFSSGGGWVALLGAFLLSVVVGDFFFYWYHRILHKSAILWQYHKMHHMDREYDALTGWRQNWTETLLSSFFSAIPMLILVKLDSVEPFKQGLFAGVFIGAIQLFLTVNHSNLRMQFGRFSFMWLSYQYHRIHHSRLPQHQDKNFVAYFPLWDILFGTYYRPAWNEFPPTGVDGEKEIQSFWESQIFAPREWWKMFRAWRRRTTASNLSKSI